MYAYDKLYLEKARTALGRMLDFAVYDLKYDFTDFFDLFIASGVANRFEQGDFTVLVGRSGIELAYLVLDEVKISYERLSLVLWSNVVRSIGLVGYLPITSGSPV